MSPNIIIENEDVLKFFIADRSLISASVNSVHIFEISESLTVDLDVTLLYSEKEEKYRIRFGEVVEYAFYHHIDRYFYYIINLKVLKDENFYYISLDPDDSVSSRSENDNNFILSNKIKAFAI